MNDYWRERWSRSLNRIGNKNIKEIEKQMRKYYKSAMNKTISEFESLYDKVLAKQAAGEEISPATLYKLQKYWDVQAQLEHELTKLGDKVAKKLSKAFEKNFFEVYYSITFENKKLFNTIDSAAARQIINQVWCADGKTWSQRIWQNTQKLMETLNEELIHVVVTGKKPTELKHKLMERFNVSYNQANSLVTTEIANIETQAAKQRYHDYGIQYMQFWAEKDERQCPECGKLHKKLYPVSGPMPVPVHPRCRCTMIPVVDDE